MKDLFRSVFDKASCFEYEDYSNDFVRNAPAWILQSAAAAHPEVAGLNGLSEVYQALADRSPSCWQNPELYPPLFRLLARPWERSDKARDVAALQVHLDLAEITPAAFSHQFFRRHGKAAATYELVDTDIRELPDAILSNDVGAPVIYKPTAHLFDDVITGSRSYNGTEIPLSNAEMERALSDALSLLKQYDHALHRGFSEAVGTVAISGEWNSGDRYGYSAASFFPGAIFASLCTESPALLVETFIHEYYHQRLWVWWLIEAPDDLPPPETTMLSPVSGQSRPVRVMLQAQLIYCSLVDYYGWLAWHRSDEGAWVSRRHQALQVGAQRLKHALSVELAGRPQSLRLLEAIVDCSESLHEFNHGR